MKCHHPGCGDAPCRKALPPSTLFASGAHLNEDRSAASPASSSSRSSAVDNGLEKRKRDEVFDDTGAMLVEGSFPSEEKERDGKKMKAGKDGDEPERGGRGSSSKSKEKKEKKSKRYKKAKKKKSKKKKKKKSKSRSKSSRKEKKNKKERKRRYSSDSSSDGDSSSSSSSSSSYTSSSEDDEYESIANRSGKRSKKDGRSDREKMVHFEERLQRLNEQQQMDRRVGRRARNIGSAASRRQSTVFAEDLTPTDSKWKDRPNDLVFMIDKQGDTTNAVFKSLAEMDVPKFHGTGPNTTLLGVDLPPAVVRHLLSSMESGREANGERWKDTRRAKRMHRYFAKAMVIRERSKETGRLRIHAPRQLPRSHHSSLVASSSVADLAANTRQGTIDQSTTSDEKLNQEEANEFSRLEDFVAAPAFTEASEDREKDEATAGSIDASFEKLRELNTRTRLYPNDIDGWLDLINFHNVSTSSDHISAIGGSLLASSNPTSSSTSSSSSPFTAGLSRKGTIEKVLSIFDRARSENPDSVRLAVEYIAYVQRVLPPDEALSKWDEVLTVHSNSPTLWKAYVLFRQGQFSTFTIPTATEVYASAVKALAVESRKRHSVLSTTPSMSGEAEQAAHEVDEALLSLITSAAHFFIQSGYSERAVGLLQAVIEFNIFPPMKGLDFETQTRLFHAFWDSDVPRIGDEDAPTWSGWHEGQQRGGPPPDSSGRSLTTASRDPAMASSSTDVLQLNEASTDGNLLAWARKEKKLSDRDWAPLRTDLTDDSRGGTQQGKEGDEKEEEDTEDEEDVDRVVILDDISPFIVSFSDHRLHIELVLRLLEVVGVDSRLLGSASQQSSNERFSVDDVANIHSLGSLCFDQISIDDAYTVLPLQQHLVGPSSIAVSGPVVDHPETAVEVVAGPSLPSEVGGSYGLAHVWNDPSMNADSSLFLTSSSAANSAAFSGGSKSLSPSRVAFVRRVLGVALSAFPRSTLLHCVSMAFEGSLSYEAATKRAREYMAVDKSNVLLMDAYAQIEMAHHRLSSVSVVFISIFIYIYIYVVFLFFLCFSMCVSVYVFVGSFVFVFSNS